jgi:hypothetical protein
VLGKLAENGTVSATQNDDLAMALIIGVFWLNKMKQGHLHEPVKARFT